MKIAVFAVLVTILAFGCSSVVIKPADFSWPIESVMKVDSKGVIHDERYSFSVNVKELLFLETQDSINVAKTTVHVIRDIRGYYYFTSTKFKNIYVLEQTDGGFKVAAKIAVSPNGLHDPAFNQRSPYVQLINGSEPVLLLTKEGPAEGAKR